MRAVAVIPVVLFHAGISQVSGGFVGVDVFFVISGYLITGLILDDISHDRFSIANFYERRIRRILPALFAVLTGTSIAAYVLLMPEMAAEFGKSLVATMCFSSNVLFWKQTGYFQSPAEMKPLLHTWSLAVEEQFYILYPLFLFLVSRYFRKRYALALLSTLVLSLALNLWWVGSYRSAAFYLAPARAWELLLGGVLALQVVPPLRHKVIDNVLGVVGLGLLFYGFIHLSGSLPFPGTNALYPVIGAALVIYSGTDGATWTAKALSLKPFVFIGLISYSLYLWHWVIIVFVKYYLVRPLTSWEVVAVIAASLVIASLSWSVIENPFRGRQHFIASRRMLFAGAALASIVIAGFGGLLSAEKGMPSRFNGKVLALLAVKDDNWKRLDECDGRICRIGDSQAVPSFVLWGDSHAGALAPVFEYLAEANHSSGFVAFKSACLPLLGLRRYDHDNIEACTRFNASVLAFLKSNHIHNVFLHGRWALNVEGSRYKQEPGTTVLLTANRRKEENYQEFDNLFRSTIEELRRLQINVTVIASVPEVGIDVPTALARNAMPGKVVDLAPTYSEFVDRQARTFSMLSRVTAAYGAQLVYPHQVLCDTTSCAAVRENHVLYVDSNHLSVQGAMYLAPAFTSLLKESVPTGAFTKAGHPGGRQ